MDKPTDQPKVQGFDVLTFLERLDAGPLQAWLAWEGPIELQLTYVSAEDIDLATEGPVALTDDQNRDFYLARVTDWRGIAGKTGGPLPFDRELLAKMWKKWPASFRMFIMRGCQRLGHFPNPLPPVGPVPPRETVPGGESGA